MTQEKTDSEPLSFEQAMAQLETIVTEVEQGKIPLAQSIEKYARGMKLIKHCRNVLEQAEKQIETISKDRPNATAEKQNENN